MPDKQSQTVVRRLVQPFQNTPGALLPALWAVQNELGYIDKASVPAIADVLNLSVAEVHGVISFYHDFKTSGGKHHNIRICRAEACQAAGSRQLQQQARDALQLEFDEHDNDAEVALESVYCLGLCACAPAAMIDGQVHGRLNAEKLASLLSRFTGTLSSTKKVSDNE